MQNSSDKDRKNNETRGNITTSFNRRRTSSLRRGGERKIFETPMHINEKLKIGEMERRMQNLKEEIEKIEKQTREETNKLNTNISNQVNWGIRTISYTSLVISLGLTMILAIIAFTFKINMQKQIAINTWELIGIIFAIFVFLSLSYAFLLWWIKKMIIHRKNP